MPMTHTRHLEYTRELLAQVPGFGAEMGQCEISIVNVIHLHHDTSELRERYTPAAFEPFIARDATLSAWVKCDLAA